LFTLSKFSEKLFLALFLALLLNVSSAFSATLPLQWDAPTRNADGSAPLTDLSGYVIYWDTVSHASGGTYASNRAVGSVTRYSLADLPSGTTFYIIVRAVDTSGNLSPVSNELRVTTPGVSVDSDGDGTPDSSDTDDDNDGLSDADENSRGTNSLARDSDGDGVEDGQEVTDGTDPTDSGSVQEKLSTTICSEWNGFFGMYNYMEHVNMSSSSRNVQISLYDINGELRDTRYFVLAAGAQFDYPVHSMAGFTHDSYGRVCSTHSGSPGDIDGRMVHYLLEPLTGHYQFAFAMPHANGKSGPQFLPFNTFQPSLDPSDAKNLVANWIQITNLNSGAASGALYFYDMAGNILGSQGGERITLRSGQRVDRAAHQFGPNIVGMVEWRPEQSSSNFLLRNVRYLYDNAEGRASFDTAFQIEGLRGSGRQLSVPIDTRGSSSILEILNTSALASRAMVKVFDSAGSQVAEFQLNEGNLPPHASLHLILDPILGAGKTGIATIEANAHNSVAAIAMQYARDSRLGVKYMYGLSAREPLGSVLRGSYNTFLSQQSSLLLVNPTKSAQTVSLTLVGSSGEVRVAGVQESIPANGFTEVNLNDFDSANRYGVVTLQSGPRSVSAWILRQKGEDYVIPTPVRE